MLQPVTFADRNSPPVLLIHGKEDKTVYEKNSLVMSMALKMGIGLFKNPLKV